MSVCDNAAAKESLSALQPTEEYFRLRSGPRLLPLSLSLSLLPASIIPVNSSHYHRRLSNYKKRSVTVMKVIADLVMTQVRRIVEKQI